MGLCWTPYEIPAAHPCKKRCGGHSIWRGLEAELALQAAVNMMDRRAIFGTEIGFYVDLYGNCIISPAPVLMWNPCHSAHQKY